MGSVGMVSVSETRKMKKEGELWEYFCVGFLLLSRRIRREKTINVDERLIEILCVDFVMVSLVGFSGFCGFLWFFI